MKWLLHGFAGLSTLWLGGFFWFWANLPRTLTSPARVDGIVIVTGGPGRLNHGLTALQEGKARRLLISGVFRTTTPAILAERTNTPLRLFACCIDLGHAAGDTIGNATEASAWVAAHNIKTLRLVTAREHMPRTALELKARLPKTTQVFLDPVPAKPDVLALTLEYSKYLLRLFWVRGKSSIASLRSAQSFFNTPINDKSEYA
jgi:uncharacterized SAM-binding protein YcdF (DUF218 family)